MTGWPAADDGRPPRILLLGGTAEADAIARDLSGRPGIAALISLAGRTAEPRPQALPTRVGGFGGADGLAAFLAAERIDLLVDATHPFAARISANAAAAAAATGVPLFRLARPAWQAEPGDRWTVVGDNAAAVAALGAAPRRVFLTIGRLGLADFAAAPQHHYLVRSIDPPEGGVPLPDHRLLLARGPFDAGAEAALIAAERIDVLVTKNSGGPLTYGKIVAARRLGLPVVLVAPPPPAGGRLFTTTAGLLAAVLAAVPAG
ncbi:cobalt-precorrin-6A reductase [Methylobrevis albus]|uniref:Cobalt-precorrin-6A reductase n=1 Tax=Methylobrevis albus TaxID=2793297 RepID=A0A931I2U5_9HYPH|nr:cobalt-precorrin-6A reductase [Methylobrevis albus]MBH0237891.1 cobalt-precorrin-6A reductase [Methylobrevis albus]